jgi:hypothetical protein
MHHGQALPEIVYIGPQPKLLNRFKASFCQNKANSKCLLKRNSLRVAIDLVHSLRNTPYRAERIPARIQPIT